MCLGLFVRHLTISLVVVKVVFGKVIDGILTLRKIENVATGPNNRPKLTVKITGS